MFGDAVNMKMSSGNAIRFQVVTATTKGIVIVVTKPNVTNIDLREAFEENSPSVFGTNFTNAVKIFEALRFSSWMCGRSGNYKADANTVWANR